MVYNVVICLPCTHHLSCLFYRRDDSSLLALLLPRTDRAFAQLLPDLTALLSLCVAEDAAACALLLCNRLAASQPEGGIHPRTLRKLVREAIMPKQGGAPRHRVAQALIIALVRCGECVLPPSSLPTIGTRPLGRCDNDAAAELRLWPRTPTLYRKAVDGVVEAYGKDLSDG